MWAAQRRSTVAVDKRRDALFSTDARKMKLTFTRSTVLTSLTVVVLLAALPGAIRRLLETGNPYLFTREFFEDMVSRLSGAGRFRFILQPTVALVIGGRDGVKDARQALPPFLLALSSRAVRRYDLLRSAFLSVRDLVSIAIILDVISQFLILRRVHPAAALVLGPVLIAVPYTVSRALANRISSRRSRQSGVLRHG